AFVPACEAGDGCVTAAVGSVTVRAIGRDIAADVLVGSRGSAGRGGADQHEAGDKTRKQPIHVRHKTRDHNDSTPVRVTQKTWGPEGPHARNRYVTLRHRLGFLRLFEIESDLVIFADVDRHSAAVDQ